MLDVQKEVDQLVVEIRRLGKTEDDGKFGVNFGVLFDDDRCANIFEALVGTLKAAKRRGKIDYKGQLLLKGVHDNVFIQLME